MKTADENANVLDVDFFQKAYDSTYKPTPPNFNSRIAYQKSTGQLSADTIKELFTPKSLLASHPFGAVEYS